MPLAEQLHHLMVRPGLIFIGEVQVNIRHLIARKAKEHLERNVEAVLHQRLAADRAVLVRQVNAHLIFALIHVEEALMAMGTAIVRRQGVHLGNAAHARHKAGAHAAAAAHQITIRQRPLHQPLRNVVQRGEAIADNGAQFLFPPLGDNLRQRIAVPFLGGVPRHILNVVRRVGPEGLEGILALGMLGEQPKLLHLIGDLPRIVNDHLVRLFLAQITEFLQHLVGSLKVQRRLIVAVLEAETRLNDRAIDGVVRVEEMHVARGYHRNAQLLAQPDNGAVQVAQALVVRHLPLPHQKGVVADGLNFQIIVEPGDLLQLVPRLTRQHRPEQLACLAGAAEDQPLPVLLNHHPRHMRTAAEIIQMPDGYQPVQVFHAFLRLYQQNDMEALADGAALQLVVQVLQGVKSLFPGLLVHFRQTKSRRRRIMHGAVRIFEAHAQRLANRTQLVALHVRVQLPCKGQRVQHRRTPAQPQPAQLRLQ